MANITKALPAVITDDYDSANVYLIPSASMVSRDEVQKAKMDGKKIVLRVDNALRNSRNRNTGMTRMRDFANMSDLVIYQSTWAKKYLQPFLKSGVVITNSVDTDLYHSYGRVDYGSNYLYSRYNRDETKGFEVARYFYSQVQQADPNATLYIVGQFSQELIDGHFDFYMDEHVKYFGILRPPEMAQLYRKSKHFVYTYFNDACSNSLIEALVSGCNIVGPYYYKTTGGAAEILRRYEMKGPDYFGLPRMAGEYLAAFDRYLNA